MARDLRESHMMEISFGHLYYEYHKRYDETIFVFDRCEPTKSQCIVSGDLES